MGQSLSPSPQKELSLATPLSRTSGPQNWETHFCVQATGFAVLCHHHPSKLMQVPATGAGFHVGHAE